jgi:hypothetical protein
VDFSGNAIDPSEAWRIFERWKARGGEIGVIFSGRSGTLYAAGRIAGARNGTLQLAGAGK